MRHCLTADLDQILASARDLAHEFSTLAHERPGHDLTQWMTRALDHGPQPVRGFAAFLPNDWDTAVNGPTLPWSSGAVEGQITRIKLIKRRSYGRGRGQSSRPVDELKGNRVAVAVRRSNDCAS